MDILAMVAVVGAVTQLLKEWLRDNLKLNVVKGWAVLLAVIVSAGVTIVYAIKLNHPIDLALLWIFIQVALYAIGGKKLLKSVLPK